MCEGAEEGEGGGEEGERWGGYPGEPAVVVECAVEEGEEEDEGVVLCRE